MKHDVFDVPLGLLREWSTCDMDRYADNGRLMYVGVCVNDFLHGLICHDDGEALRGRYVVVDSYACFGDDRFGPVCSCGHGYFDLLADALAYVDWMYDADRESLHDCTHMGHDYEVWHVVGDAPSGDLAPELPAMALEVVRQLREAGELGDPDDLTDDDFLPTTYHGDLPLATVTRSDSDRPWCVFLPTCNVSVSGCEWVKFLPRPDCPGILSPGYLTYHLNDHRGIWNMLVVSYSDQDDRGWYNDFEDEIRTLCHHLFVYAPGETDQGCMSYWFSCSDVLDVLGLDLCFGYSFYNADVDMLPPARVPVPVEHDDYWDVRPAPEPLDSWFEIDIQPSESEVQ